MADASTDQKATSPDDPNVETTDQSGDATTGDATGEHAPKGRRLLRSRRGKRTADGTSTDATSSDTDPTDTDPTDADSTDTDSTDTAPTENAAAENATTDAADATGEQPASGDADQTVTPVSTTKTGTTKTGTTKTAANKAGTGKGSAATKAGAASKAGAATNAGAGTKAGAATKGKGGKQATASERRAGAAGRLARIITALAVLAVLLAVVVLVELIRGSGDSDEIVALEDRREAARQAAETTVPRLYSYDYRRIDADLAEQARVTTGEINDAIQKTTAPALKQLAPRTTSVVQAVVLSSAATDVVGEDVKVLVFMNQAVNNNLLSAPRLDRSRVLATMRLVDGQWKVARIEPL